MPKPLSICRLSLYCDLRHLLKFTNYERKRNRQCSIAYTTDINEAPQKKLHIQKHILSIENAAPRNSGKQHFSILSFSLRTLALLQCGQRGLKSLHGLHQVLITVGITDPHTAVHSKCRSGYGSNVAYLQQIYAEVHVRINLPSIS